MAGASRLRKGPRRLKERRRWATPDSRGIRLGADCSMPKPDPDRRLEAERRLLPDRRGGGGGEGGGAPPPGGGGDPRGGGGGGPPPPGGGAPPAVRRRPLAACAPADNAPG